MPRVTLKGMNSSVYAEQIHLTTGHSKLKLKQMCRFKTIFPLAGKESNFKTITYCSDLKLIYLFSCETLEDVCSLYSCDNGKCNNVSDIRRTCVCDFGYQGEDCSTEIGKLPKTGMNILFQFMSLCY